MASNIILATDSYKHSHFLQYPAGAKHVSSYIEARIGADHKQVTQFFGIDAYILENLMSPLCSDDIAEAKELLEAHGLPFNEVDWNYIRDHHEGYLPIEIQALPEGLVVPRGIPLIQVRNTDPKLPWLTSFIETGLLRAVWYPSSVATLSFLTKAIIWEALQRTSDDPDGQIGFKLHDFGARGCSSAETAALGGMAHLLNFKGSDTLEAIHAVQRYYCTSDMPGFSIPASEHSTMTSWGKDRESEAYANMMDTFGSGMFSIVSDSYDIFNAVENIFGNELKDKILNLEGKLIVRPDSGNPVLTPIAVLEKLWASFGGSVNSKGYKVLNPKIGLIQGDGMNAHSIAALVAGVAAAGFSVDNIAFGMGGGLLQGHMRDDMRFAMKANAIDFGEGWVDVQKKPASDPTKTSKAGRQAVYRVGTEYFDCREDQLPQGEVNLLETVYRDGECFLSEEWSDLTKRAHEELLTFHGEAFYERKEAAE
jgi:nicotinamide phosphoribosyltransferase